MLILDTSQDILGLWTTTHGVAVPPPVMLVGSMNIIDVTFVANGAPSVDLTQYDTLVGWIGDYANKINITTKNCTILEENALRIRFDLNNQALANTIGKRNKVKILLELRASDSTGNLSDFAAQGVLVIRNRVSPLPADPRESAILGRGVLGLMILGKE